MGEVIVGELVFVRPKGSETYTNCEACDCDATGNG